MDIDCCQIFEAMGLQFRFVLSDEHHQSIDALVNGRVHIVRTRLHVDVKMDKIHEHRTVMLHFLRIERHCHVNDLIGDVIDSIHFLKDVVFECVCHYIVFANN
jgi:hypothetical protein